jgi:hypothetical protein
LAGRTRDITRAHALDCPYLARASLRQPIRLVFLRAFEIWQRRVDATRTLCSRGHAVLPFMFTIFSGGFDTTGALSVAQFFPYGTFFILSYSACTKTTSFPLCACVCLSVPTYLCNVYCTPCESRSNKRGEDWMDGGCEPRIGDDESVYIDICIYGEGTGRQIAVGTPWCQQLHTQVTGFSYHTRARVGKLCAAEFRVGSDSRSGS